MPAGSAGPRSGVFVRSRYERRSTRERLTTLVHLLVLKAAQRAKRIRCHDHNENEEHHEYGPEVEHSVPGEWTCPHERNHAERNIDSSGEEAEVSDPAGKQRLLTAVDENGDPER